MTRCFFYTDPLAAAWMAKHFGMDFIAHGGVFGSDGNTIIGHKAEDRPFREVWVDCGYADICSFNDLITVSCDRKYYVHPESLQLLEPQVGDLTDDGEWVVQKEDGLALHPEVQVATAQHWLETRQQFKIIQRNGTPFMWPESEAA